MLVLTNRARQVPGSNFGVSSTDFQVGIMKESSLIAGAVIPRVGLWGKLHSSLFHTVSVIFCRCICFKRWPGLLVLHGDSTCTHSNCFIHRAQAYHGVPTILVPPKLQMKGRTFRRASPGSWDPRRLDWMEDGGLSATLSLCLLWMGSSLVWPCLTYLANDRCHSFLAGWSCNSFANVEKGIRFSVYCDFCLL